MSWPMVTLESISEFIRNGASIKQEKVASGLPITRIETIAERKVNLKKCGYADIKHDEYKDYRLLAGDILISHINSEKHLGKCAIFEDDRNDIIHGMNLLCLRPIKDKVFPKYLFRFLSSPVFLKLISSITKKSVNQASFTVTAFKSLEIPLPPLTEQKRIAAILDKADGIRQKREQAIKLADDFLRATFLEMFGDPVENPKGWKVKPLISLIVGKLQNGAYFPKEKYSKEGVEMVHMADAFYDVIQRGSLKRVQASDADIVKYRLTHEDLMISRRSLNYEGAAKPSLIPQSDEPLIFESSMIRITPDKKQIDKLFLFYYLTVPLVKEHFIRKFVTGATIKGINQKNLEQVRIIVPPLELQKKFSHIVHTLEKHKKKLNESEIHSIELFTAISQRAFLEQL